MIYRPTYINDKSVVDYCELSAPGKGVCSLINHLVWITHFGSVI